MKKVTKDYTCKMCLKKGLNELDSFANLKRVTSDCKPFESGGRLLICCNCGGVQKIPDDKWLKEISLIYKNYDTFSLPGFTDQVIMDGISQTLQPRCNTLVKYLKNYLDLDDEHTWLDFGCGRGAMLNAASKICKNLYGLDLDNSHESYLSGIENFKKLYTISEKEKMGEFNVISMVHSLEHFTDPYVELTDAYNLLTDEGVLFIQVNDTRLNPFEILVADHLTHFEPYTLSEMVKKVGYKVLCVTNDWVTKEISLVAMKTNEKLNPHETANELTHNLDKINSQVDWLNALSIKGRQLAEQNKNFGIFGSAVASTWLAKEIGEQVLFFVDEDVDRIGGKHMNKPIRSPLDLTLEDTTYIGLIPIIANKIYNKLNHLDTNFEISPEYDNSKNKG
jgi:2-polyprenyl-3-methyl-5-hydroxy-6-metoxy-1,4-benzoquinol methylase